VKRKRSFLLCNSSTHKGLSAYDDRIVAYMSKQLSNVLPALPLTSISSLTILENWHGVAKSLCNVNPKEIRIWLKSRMESGDNRQLQTGIFNSMLDVV
jgi:hypothetical protein